MFFKKKKAEQLEQLHAEWKKQEDVFDKKIDSAMELVNPADKALALRGVADEIGQYQAATNAAFYDKNLKVFGKSSLGTAGATTAGTVAVGVLVAAPMAIPVLVVGLLGGLYGSGKYSDSIQKKLEEEFKDHGDHMTAQGELANAAAADTIERNPQKIAASDRYAEVMDDAMLARAFADAAAKKMTSNLPALDASDPADPIGKVLKDHGAEQRARFERLIRIGQQADPLRKQKPQGPAAP